MLFGLMLVLSMIAATSRIGGGLTIEGAALRDCVGGDQAWNHDAPGQPPPRLQEAELRKDNQDESDSCTAKTDIARELAQPCAGRGGRLPIFERRSQASLRAREGHGARGPPRA